MNEMRRDPVTRKWVIIDRSFTPENAINKLRTAVEKDHERISADPCAFCPGKESSTPPPIMEFAQSRYLYREHSDDWQIRVIPNEDPVFRIEGALNRRFISIYDVMDAVGAHEILIEHREHRDWDELRADEVSAILGVYRERVNDLSKDERFGHLFIFKNYGPSSRIRIQHPHSTVIASPSVPERIRRELSNTRKHFDMKERCLYCDIITEELRRKDEESGLVRMYENFVTISPYFASHPFETWILPRKHSSDFRTASAQFLSELGTVLQNNLRMIKKVVMGTGFGTGDTRAIDAAKRAISSPLLEEASMQGARGILINICAGDSLTLYEVDQACKLVHENAHEDATIIFGAHIDPNMKEDVKVTVIATGFEPTAMEAAVAPPSLRSVVNRVPEPVAAHTASQQQENVSFYRKAAGQTPGAGGAFPFEERDDLDIPTFKRKS